MSSSSDSKSGQGHRSVGYVALGGQGPRLYDDEPHSPILPPEEASSSGDDPDAIAGALQLADDAKVLQLQDKAPGHCSDNCRTTGDTGLNARRSEQSSDFNIINHLYSFCGTPEQCVNDHSAHSADAKAKSDAIAMQAIQASSEKAPAQRGAQ